jgi:hypothetical protein
MLSGGSALLVVLGFAFAIVGALSRGYMRNRLRESGFTLTGWITVQDDLRSAEQYFQLTKRHLVPMWPLGLVVVCLPGGFLLVLFAILRG